ncbi:MAG TPA: DUF2846 domain-containing protein [Nevskia sp.]|jgi:hypothetical protein|nr:DUF2846 domain-containing protein [Nevskia sp.]
MSRAIRFSQRSFIFAAILLLTACARDMNYVQMKALMPPPPADKGRIYFYREFAWLGNVVTPDILLNNESVGISNPGRFFYVDREPGEYRAICGKGDDHAVNFSLAAGQEVYVRTAVAGGIVTASMQTEVVAPSLAIPQMRDLNYSALQ